MGRSRTGAVGAAAGGGKVPPPKAQKMRARRAGRGAGGLDAGSSNSLRGRPGAKQLGWVACDPDAEPETRGGNGNVRTSLENIQRLRKGPI